MQSPHWQEKTIHKWLYFFIALAALVNFSGLFVPLMDPDAGVYASVSKNMLLNNDYVNLYYHDIDWLDKPHFPFWITALFFKLFGLHSWSYKLPGVLFVMLGAWYTWLFAKKHYNKTIALWAVFILLTAEHILISNNDVRAEPFLTGLVIASIYHFSVSLSKNSIRHLAAACFFTGCSMMTKGLFTLIPIGGAVAGQLIIQQNWKQVFHWKWLLALLLTTIFISPELYCLWRQFDSHPEKTIFGRTHVSGIRFFLWDSQFGRFMNTGPIKGTGDPFFFLHTLLWAFLPWALILYVAIFMRFRNSVKKIRPEFNEWYTIPGSLLTLLVFSLSRFQQPYYSNLIFPMLAVLSANFIWQKMQSGNRVFAIIQTVIAFLVIGLGAAVFIYYKPSQTSLASIIIILLLLLLLFFLPALVKKAAPAIPYLRSGLAVLIVSLFANLIFYPDLLKYQSGNEVAFYINKNLPGIPVARIGIIMPSGEFYLDRHMGITDSSSIAEKKLSKPVLLFLTAGEMEQLKRTGSQFEMVKEFNDFHVTVLTPEFLNPKTREQQLEKRYLVKLL